MTITQPYKNRSIINILIFVSFVLSIILAIVLVFLYNNVLNFEDRINSLKQEIKKVETDIAESKEELFNILSGENLEKIAIENGLVVDKNPEYFEIKKLDQWQIGLNF